MDARDTSRLESDAASCVQRGELEQALRLYADLELSDPQCAKWPRHTALVLGRLGQRERQISALDRALGLLVEQGDILRATAVLKEALAIEPRHSRAEEWLARLHTRATGAGADSTELPTAEPSSARLLFPAAPVFSSIQRAETFHQMVKNARVVTLKKDEFLFHQGDPAEALFLVAEGAVAVIDEGPPWRGIAKLQEGQVFGEFALLTERTRTASVVALSDTSLISLERSALHEVMQADPQVLATLLNLVKERLPRDFEAAENDEGALAVAFAKIDVNGDGHIDEDELQILLKDIGAEFTEAQLADMMQHANSAQSGTLSYDDFRAALLSKSSITDLEDARLQEVKPYDIIDAGSFVSTLQLIAANHHTCRHPFLSRLADGDLPDPAAAIRLFAGQFRPYTARHSDLLRAVVGELGDDEGRRALLDCLREEAGQLSDADISVLQRAHIEPRWVLGLPHSKLFERFCEAMGVEPNSSRDIGDQFYNRISSLCQESAPTAVAALAFGIEAVVPKVYAFITRAVEDHTDLTPEQYVFFPLHERIDDEHSKILAKVAGRLSRSREHRKSMYRGMMEALDARSAFFDALLAVAEAQPSVCDAFPAQPTARKLYDESGHKWARTDPTCLSDFTAREPLFAHLGDLEGLRVLDVGCGDGYCCRAFKARGASEVIGVDISQTQIDAAQAEEQRSPLGIRYLCGDATDTLGQLDRHRLWRDATGKPGFDVVTAVFLFNYQTLAEMQTTLDQVRRLLRPGGRFVFTVPHPTLPFWRRSSKQLFYFDLEATKGRNGYFDGRDRLFPGRISTRDGDELEVQLRHKTLADIFNTLREAGFLDTPAVQELGVVSAEGDDAWLAPLEGVPLHVMLTVNCPEPRRLISQKTKPIKDIIWSRIYNPASYTMEVPDALLAEFEAAYARMGELAITWETYARGDVGELSEIRKFAMEMRRRLMEDTGLVLVQGIDLASLHEDYEQRVQKAKTLYLLMSMEVGDVLERRGRLYEVKDRGLDVTKDNVLFSSSNAASGFHTDSTDRDYNPDVVGLLCIEKACEGGALEVVNALNVFLHLKQTLPDVLMRELERPVIRDLVESGQGEKSGSLWEQLRRSSKLNVQRQRLRMNAFPIFSRNAYTDQFSFRYMRFWIESGHRRAGVTLSPLLVMAMNALDEAITEGPNIYRVQRTLEPGEMLWTNNHICAHNRSAFKTNPPGEKPRLQIRVWINFNPVWHQ